MEPEYSTPSSPPGPTPPPQPPAEEDLGSPEDSGDAESHDRVDRDQILRDLKAKLQESQKEAERLKKLADRFQTDVEALQKTSQEIDSVVDGYRKDYRRIRSELGTFRCWFEQKYAEVRDTLPANERQEVERKRREVDAHIADLEEIVQSLAQLKEVLLQGGANDSVQYAEIQVTNASTGPGGADDRARAYELLKNFHKQVLDDLKKLEGWKKDIDDAIAKSKLRIAWFLLLDFKDLLENLEKRVDEMPPSRLSEKLDRAWYKLVKARKDLRDAEATRNARAFALESKKKALEEARKTRRDRILEAIGRG